MPIVCDNQLDQSQDFFRNQDWIFEFAFSGQRSLRQQDQTSSGSRLTFWGFKDVSILNPVILSSLEFFFLQNISWHQLIHKRMNLIRFGYCGKFCIFSENLLNLSRKILGATNRMRRRNKKIYLFSRNTLKVEERERDKQISKRKV